MFVETLIGAVVMHGAECDDATRTKLTARILQMYILLRIW